MHKKDKGPSKHQKIQKMHTETKIERIIKLIRKGVSYTEILDSFPTMSKQILAHMHLRPGRKHKTMCCYVCGPTGIGKTLGFNKFLQRVANVYPHITTYHKAHGFNKEYWDGYINQPIVLLLLLLFISKNCDSYSLYFSSILKKGEK